MVNGDKPNVLPKEFDTPAESSIPLDVHLPSSLLPDLLPSNSKRAGPLYNRQPSKANTKLEPDFTQNKAIGSITENFSKTMTIRDGAYDAYATSYVTEKSAYKMENGDMELARKATYVEYEQRQNKVLDKCPPELQTKQLFGQPNVWNLLPYSLHNDNAGLSDASAMTYAAALRQTQDKLPERNVNDKSYFNFN